MANSPYHFKITSKYEDYKIITRAYFNKRNGQFFASSAYDKNGIIQYHEIGPSSELAKQYVIDKIKLRKKPLNPPLNKNNGLNQRDLQIIEELKKLSNINIYINSKINTKNPQKKDISIIIKNYDDSSTIVDLTKKEMLNYLTNYYSLLSNKNINKENIANNLLNKVILPILDERNKIKNKKNNPFNIKFDYLIIENGKNKISYTDKYYNLQENLSGMNRNHAIDKIIARHPGKLLAYKYKNDAITSYGLYSGVKYNLPKEKTNTEYFNNIKDLISKSLSDNTSVLLQNNNKLDYSFNAKKGKPFDSINQLYFQQIRKNYRFKSPYFTSTQAKSDVHPKSKSILLGEYDPIHKYMHYQFYNKFDQLYKIKQPELVPLKTNINEAQLKTLFNKTKTVSSEKDYQDIFQDNLSRYFHSIYTGKYDYKPDRNLLLYKNQISKAINNYSISLFSSIKNAQNNILKKQKEHTRSRENIKQMERS